MNKYELVLVVDPRLPKAEMDGIVSTVESMLGDGIKDKDEIGMLELVTQIKGNDNAYFVSYYIELDPTVIVTLKRDLTLTKGILRFSLFSMKDTEKFFKFHEVNKMFEISEEEKQKLDNRNAFHDMDLMSKVRRRR